jgi:hypothetical protein
VLLIVMLIDMKTTEETDFGFKSELQFHYNYSFFDNDLRIKQLENHDFIVPWQMVETEKKEVLVE